MTDRDVDQFQDWCEQKGGHFRQTTESKTERTKWECSVAPDLVSMVEMRGDRKHIEITQGDRNNRSGVHVATMGMAINDTGSIQVHGPSMKVKKDASHRGVRFE